MAKTEAFENYTREYDEWFERNQIGYISELTAVRSLAPEGKLGLEIGTGTGKFGVPLGVRVGVESCHKMAYISG
jgi:hypothetical protein